MAEVIERIQQMTGRLTGGARKVAELIVESPQEVALSTAARVAERLGISQSTVVRFATALGYDGYPALRRELQDLIRRNLEPAQRLNDFATGAHGQRPLHRSFQSDADNLAVTEQGVVARDFDAAVSLISAARTVYIFGLRSSFGIAHTLSYLLHQTLGTARLLDAGRGELPDQLMEIGPRDVLIAISFPRYTRQVIETMDLAAARKARLIAITDGPLSPLAARAEVVLKASCGGSGFANSNVAAVALVNALVAEVAVRNKPRAVKVLAQLEWTLRQGEVLEFGPDNAPDAGDPAR
ncbi:RpiR family transcriptional regulator [Stella humosa]|uniref:RpiR family transcriptional regulator n=1 Tax=Stella humosa TaxID=94 RepID=A0A3N1MDC4_9PROT|nr:MurR/RpiR family transcriptional regulator [Stella humosa]ROQ01731.1 RpiR family transcriptional regulator [Stella humosa]BBK32113.1 N-acetylmannosamine kinase [Stella humosa]